MIDFLNSLGYPENFTKEQISEIQKAIEICDNKVVLRSLLDNRYNIKQIKEIVNGIKDNIPVHYYAKINYDSYQMREIRIGISQGVNVKKYCNKNYSYIDMKKIRQKELLKLLIDKNEKEKYYELLDGINKGINIDLIYGDYDVDQIKEIKKILEKNIFVNFSPRYSAQHIIKIRKSIENNFCDNNNNMVLA